MQNVQSLLLLVSILAGTGQPPPTGVITRNGIASEIDSIRVPTLILVGDEDVAVPLVHSQRLQEGITGSRLEVIPRAGHTSTVEEPTAVNVAITTFLGSISSTHEIEERDEE